MYGARAVWKALLAVTLVTIWVCPVLAERGYPVDSELLPDAFNLVFTLETSWNPDHVTWWPESTIVEFANLVMPDLGDSLEPEDSYAHRTAYFFGVDKDGDYPGIHFQYCWEDSAYDINSFYILISGSCNSLSVNSLKPRRSAC